VLKQNTLFHELFLSSIFVNINGTPFQFRKKEKKNCHFYYPHEHFSALITHRNGTLLAKRKKKEKRAL